jgi:hypothetical protein
MSGGAAQPVLPAHQQRIVVVGFENGVGRGAGYEAHVAAERGRILDAHAVQDLGLLDHFGLDGLLHRRSAGVLLDVAQQDLFQARRVVEEIRLTTRSGCCRPDLPGRRQVPAGVVRRK